MARHGAETGTGRGTGFLESTCDRAVRYRAVRSERRLARRRARWPGLRLVSEALEGLPYDWDLATGTVVRSAAFPALLGFAPGEAAPDADWWQSRVHPEDRDGAVAAARAAFDDPVSARMVAEVQRDVAARSAAARARWDEVMRERQAVLAG